MFKINYIEGDLFDCVGRSAMANCVSRDLQMGKGIARLFQSAFRDRSSLREQNKGIGEVAITKHNGHFIYYLITKNRYYQKPTYKTVSSALKAMREHCVLNNVKHISIPKLSCGLDNLDWERVSALLCVIFFQTNIQIDVYCK